MADCDHHPNRRALIERAAHIMVDVCDEARAYLLSQAVAAEDHFEEHAWLTLAAHVNQTRLHNLAKLNGADQPAARPPIVVTTGTSMQVTRDHLVVTGG